MKRFAISFLVVSFLSIDSFGAGLDKRYNAPKVGKEYQTGETQEKRYGRCVELEKLHPITGEVIRKERRCD